MRDIQSDLQERLNAAELEVRTVAVEYEKKIGPLLKERDAKVEKAKTKLDLLSKLIEFENEAKNEAISNEAISKVPSEAPPPGPPQLPHLVPPPNGSHAPNPLAQMIGLRKIG